MKGVYEWLNNNLLTLNKTKTVYLPFSVTSKTEPNPLLSIKLHTASCMSNQCDCYVLKSCNYTKYLGITIDKNLRWTPHISDTVKKARNLMYVFYRLRHFLPTNMLLTVYKTLAQLILQYGIIGWGGVSLSKMNPLITTQKYILKVLLNKKMNFSSNLTYELTNVLDIKQIYIKSIILHVFKNKNLYKIVELPNNNISITRSKFKKHLLCVPRKHKAIAQAHVDFLGPKVFNQIPRDLIICNQLKHFKHYIHTWILKLGRDLSYDLLHVAN